MDTHVFVISGEGSGDLKCWRVEPEEVHVKDGDLIIFFADDVEVQFRCEGVEDGSRETRKVLTLRTISDGDWDGKRLRTIGKNQTFVMQYKADPNKPGNARWKYGFKMACDGFPNLCPEMSAPPGIIDP